MNETIAVDNQLSAKWNVFSSGRNVNIWMVDRIQLPFWLYLIDFNCPKLKYPRIPELWIISFSRRTWNGIFFDKKEQNKGKTNGNYWKFNHLNVNNECLWRIHLIAVSAPLNQIYMLFSLYLLCFNILTFQFSVWWNGKPIFIKCADGIKGKTIYLLNKPNTFFIFQVKSTTKKIEVALEV